MSVCPNINLEEWKQLEASVGRFEAFKDFMEYNGEIRTPEQVKAKIALRNSAPLLQLEREGVNNEPIGKEILTTMLDNLIKKFPDQNLTYKFINDSNSRRRGWVQPPSEMTGNKTIIFVNTAKATLDTPLHEFGHIFINMIKAGNRSLYGKLMQRVFQSEVEMKDESGKTKWVSKTMKEKWEGKGFTATGKERMVNEQAQAEIERLVNDPQYAEIEGFTNQEEAEMFVKEEVLVELLGLKAAGLVDSKSGLFKALEAVWDAVVKFIRDNFKFNGKIDVVNIKPEASLETLAYLLTSDNLAITVGTSKKEAIKERVDERQAKVDEAVRKLEFFENNLNELDYVWDHQTSNHFFVSKGLNSWRINRLPTFIQQAKDYISGQKISEDITKLGERLAADRGPFDEALARILETKEFKTLFWFVDTMQSDTKKGLIYDNLKVFHDNLAFPGTKGVAHNHIRKMVKEEALADFNSSLGQVTVKVFRGNLVHRFGEERVAAGQLWGSFKAETPEEIQEQILRVKNSLKDNVKLLEEDLYYVKKYSGKSFNKSYKIEVKNPEGKMVEDTMTVTVNLRTNEDTLQRVAGVSFSSNQWGYADPYWIIPYEPGVNITPDKTTVKFKDMNMQALVKDVYPDGQLVLYVKNKPHRAEVPWTDHYDAEGYLTNFIVVDPKLIDITIRQQRAFKVMDLVTQAISEFGYDHMVEGIEFDAAAGQSLTRESGEERRELYDTWAGRLFGEYKEDLIQVGEGGGYFIIPIPEGFKAGAIVRRTLLQTERDNSPELPFEGEEKNSLIGHAMATVGSVPNDVSELTNTRVRAIEFANKLSARLGIDYQIISEREAEELTKDAQNPWSGEKAFFIGGRVYFVGDHLSNSMVLHEFAHPLVRAISMENRELFTNLFNQVVETPEGQDILEQVRNRADIAEGSDMFMEEVIVKALEKGGMDQINNEKTQSRFQKVLNNILYAFKQMLRRMFGKKASVSKLSTTTTMKELTDMLVKGGEIAIDTETVNQDDVVAYMREQEEYVEDLMNIDNQETQALINRAHDILTKHIDTLLSRREYEELAQLLTDEFQRGDLQEMKKNLSQYQTAVANMAEQTKEDIEYTKKKVTALVNTIFRLDTVMTKVLLHMQDISRELDSQENLHRAYYYDYLVKYWEQFVNEANQALDDPKNAVPANSPMSNLVGNISRTISRIKNLTNEMYADGARDTLYQELTPMNESMKNRYETMLENLKKRNAPQSKIDRIHKEYYGLTEADYNRMKELQSKQKTGVLSIPEQNQLDRLMRETARGLAVTPEKIEALLKGEMGDANFFNSYLEGYLYNTDPVVGGLALYVKNKMNEVMTLAQSKFNDFAKDMKPLLDAAGYNPANIGELGQKVGFVDKTSKRDEDGNLIEREVWTLLNPFVNYRLDYDKHNDAVESARFEFARTGTTESRTKMINAISDKKEFMRKYFHQRYVPQFYEREALFEQDEIGKEAAYLRDNLFERMRMITEPATTESDLMNINDELDMLWREYRQLHSRYDLNGELKTGKDLEIAKRLRQYREDSREFYEWKMRQGVFENALQSYEQELADKGLKEDDPEFTRLRNQWIKRNTRTVVKDQFYADRQRILDRIAELVSKLPDNEQKNLDTSVLWEQIFELTGGFRDDDGQPNATNMSEGSIAKVKRLSEELDELRKNFMQRNGLTAAENERLRELFEIKQERRLDTGELSEFRALYDKKNTFGLSKLEIAELDGLYEELDNMSKREATTYYADIMNNWLTKLDTDELFLDSGSRSITPESAQRFLKGQHIQKMLAENEDFRTWFEANHIYREKFNKETGESEWGWERLYVWSKVLPKDENYMETYDVTDAQGNMQTLQGLPSMKYYARVVKPEYRTERVVGETVDNKGNWLPKTMEQGAADDRYINKAYYNLQKEDPNMFAVLEKLKEHHLKNQEGVGYKSRLYLDFPRFRKSSLEVLQTKGIKGTTGEKMNALTIYAKRVKDFFYGAKDDAQSGFNDKDEFNLVRADMFDNEITSVPIAGLYDIDMDDVSTDITNSMMRYMLSAERQKQLVKISPVARAVQSVVNDPKNAAKEIDRVNKFNFIHRGIKSYMNKKGMYVRRNAVNNFIEREFEGQRMAGATKDVKWLNNTANLLFKRASFGFFALNIPSALKNSYGAKFQAMIEASAGRHMSHTSLQQGNAWAYTTMAELSMSQLYKRGPKSLRQQIVEIFDPMQDRFEEKFGESLSRTIGKDIANFSWLYNFRKWVELQATVQTFGGMMYHQKVKQFEGTENEKEISYMDAWELRDEKIQLKEGIDPKWGITYDEEGNQQVGSEFKRYRNLVHQTMNNLQGAYAKFDQPEAQRYLAFRFISYLRRYFTTMTLNRFGFSGRWFNPQPRLNVGAGDVQMGFYIEFIRTAKDTITTLGRNLAYLTPEEKKAALKVMTEVGMLVATIMAMSLLFGWDPDDDDKFAKLRERSGALPFPFVAEDPDREFNGWGFLENHALYLLMNIRAENEQFIPLPGYGLDDFTAMLDLKSIAFGPTVKTYKELFEDVLGMAQGDERAYYKRQVGPYEWQQQGGSKFWAHLARTIGLTGSSLDPAKGIKGFQSVQARAR